MKQSLELPLQQEINRVCFRFEDEWQSGCEPVIGDYLPLGTPAARHALLRELILLDVDYRQRQGLPWDIDDYVRRLPEQEAVIRNVFQAMRQFTEPSLQSQLDTSHIAGGKTPAPHGIEANEDTEGDQHTVGRYRLEERIGDGGFGVVYRATDTELHREVAVKIPHGHLSDGTLNARLYLTEARTVAELDHPNIVPVYDVGRTSDDRVYFVMKYLPYYDYGRQIASGQVHPREAARQFAELADALAYAHAKGIIHRDIKPGNILLEDRDKLCLVDFGLAARNSDDTARGSLVGTPAYMSPEQASQGREAITERSDIYGLGATLYHALTGRTPVQANSTREMLRRIGQEQPSPLRQLRPSIPRALETICLKCLEKDPNERYARAGQLADDLHRFLRREPIQARPVGHLERSWRWAARRPTLAGLLFLAAMILLVGPVVAVVMNSLRLKALEQTARAERVTEYMVDAFRSPDPDRDGKTITVYELLERAVSDLDDRFEGDRLLNAEFSLAIGETLQNLGVPSEAIVVLERARDCFQGELGERDPSTLRAMFHLADAYLSAGQLEESISLFQSVFELRAIELGSQHPDTLKAASGFAKAHFEAGNYDASLPLLENTLELRRSLLGEHHLDTLVSMNNLGRFYSAAGRNDDAIPLLEEALELRRRELGPEHRQTLATQNNLAQAYWDASREKKGLALMKESVDIMRRTLGEEHGATLNTKWRLAMYLEGAGKLADALPIMEQVLQARKAEVGEEHPATISLMQNLGNKYRTAGHLEKARAMLEETLDLARDKLGEDHPTTLATMHSLAWTLMDNGQREEGTLFLERVLELGAPKLGEAHPHILGTMSNLGMVYRAAGRLDDSFLILERAYAIADTRLDDGHHITQMIKENLDLTNQELTK